MSYHDRRPKTLITSAAGKTGMATALQMLDKGYPVRAFVRTDDHRARRLKEAGAEIFVGDQYAVADMRRAMTGIQRAYLCAPAAPNGLHFGAVFAAAAAERKLEHVVMLSQWLSGPDHPSLFTRETWLTERILEALPDTTITVNNVGWFADNYFLVMAPMAQLGLMPMPLGDGDAKTNAPPSNEDIASVSVGALIDPATHAGKVYRPTGPHPLSPNEIASTIGEALGRRVRYRDISEAMFLKALKVNGRPTSMAVQLRYYTNDYRLSAFGTGAPTDAVRLVGGREPEDFATIARRYVATMPEARRSLSARLAALAFLARILITRRIDPNGFERGRDHVLLKVPKFAIESTDWRQSHDPRATPSNDPSIDENLPAKSSTPVAAAI